MEAPSAGYLLPTLEPERTTPPGKGMMMLGTRRMASTAASAPASAAAVSFASSSDPQTDPQLSQLGMEGWELVAVADGAYLLKRPKAE